MPGSTAIARGKVTGVIQEGADITQVSQFGRNKKPPLVRRLVRVTKELSKHFDFASH